MTTPNKNLFERADNSKSNQTPNADSAWKPLPAQGAGPSRMKKGLMHSQPDNTTIPMAPLTGVTQNSGNIGGAMNSVFNKSNFSAVGSSQQSKIPPLQDIFGGGSKATGTPQSQAQTGSGTNQAWPANSQQQIFSTGTTGSNKQPGIFTPNTGSNTTQGNQSNNALIWGQNSQKNSGFQNNTTNQGGFFANQNQNQVFQPQNNMFSPNYSNQQQNKTSAFSQPTQKSAFPQAQNPSFPQNQNPSFPQNQGSAFTQNKSQTIPQQNQVSIFSQAPNNNNNNNNNIFSQNQGAIFPPNNPNPMVQPNPNFRLQLQPSNEMEYNMLQYVQQFDAAYNQPQPPFGQPGQQPFAWNQNQPGSRKLENQINPRKADAEYRNQLNNIASNEAVQKFATTKEVLEFAEGLANQVVQPDDVLSSLSEARKKEVTKLFERSSQNYPSAIRARELEPCEDFDEVLDKMNDDLSCRFVLQNLWNVVKSRLEEMMKMLNALEKKIPKEEKERKFKDCSFKDVLLSTWQKAKGLSKTLDQITSLEKIIDQESDNFNSKIWKVCQEIRTCFVQTSKENRIVTDLEKQMSSLNEFFESQILPICKNHTEGKPISFEDPDSYILAFAGKLLVRYKELDMFAEEMEKIQELHINDVNMKELVEGLCQLYQNLAEKLYDTNCKVKECANFVARDRDFADYERVLAQIQEKTEEDLGKKLAVYNKIKEIESIIKGRGPLVKVPHIPEFDKVSSTSTLFNNNSKEVFPSK